MTDVIHRIERWWCERTQHDWFPPPRSSEFLPVKSTCLRCRTTMTNLPHGECLGGHPLADHYDRDGERVPFVGCRLGGPA